MNRSTAIRHLEEMAAEATGTLRHLQGSEISWPLEEIWTAGDLLDRRGDLDAGTVILMLDVAPDELPWLARHPSGEWIGERLRLGKRPMMWTYRPHVWPAWNARCRRVLRIWSATAGADQAVIEALRSGAPLEVVEPDERELRSQLRHEAQLSRAHLRRVVDDHGEDGWHRGRRAEREDELWRAAAGLLEIDEALARLDH
jgi:hypothetical protein